ncbi:response regulator [Simiduia agarivorans]|uniref:Chemotaxis response regulator n=1 Tax=Simiduia agarivorans (strain DSM 21679 / JCM 13881 / BCRC 17597 / SA1) TaxID=1117647 RepID=K4KEH0_SIMAS|nr:response regulator [Simiduia agarivorans]AFU97316.1 chemotaxis response regulator [Simiduia agarivorans SA1 = DSM 21679]
MACVLVVDDSVSMRGMVAATLAADGHRVVEAEDGVEALARAQAAQFDAVITDVNMPRMDGITLVRELRKLTQFKYTPILVLTTESSVEKKQEGRAAGATGWLVKPFNPEKLLATVARVLD